MRRWVSFLWREQDEGSPNEAEQELKPHTKGFTLVLEQEESFRLGNTCDGVINFTHWTFL